MNRPVDDLSQVRVRLEAEAVVAILKKVEVGDWTLLSSSILVLELSQTSDRSRRNRALETLLAAQDHYSVGEKEHARAEFLEERLGVRAMDALHLACAESLRADVLLTTDDRLLRAVQRGPRELRSLVVANPLAWLTKSISGS